MPKKLRKSIIVGIIVVLALAVLIPAFCLLDRYNLLPQRAYTAEKFGIETVKSEVDFNQNGIDDYTDILLGARKDAENHPTYNSAYFQGGYPPDHIGVCTDVVWRAFKEAGYSLRDMVDKDIYNNPDEYPAASPRDNNIDFRRVRNLRVFFEKYAQKLTNDTTEIAEWQAGDIVIFGSDKHIGIVSDKRTRKGITYIIHNGGQPMREENYLKRGEVTGHYRFDASKIDESVLIAWED